MRAWFYFTVNAIYSAVFTFVVIAVWEGACYTVNGIDTPVTRDTGGAVNTTRNWNLIFLAAACVYGLSACSAFAFCFSGVWGRRLQIIDKYISYVGTLIFITLHITRWTHSGAVCAGDYLTEEQIESGDTDGYLLTTGKFLTWFIIIGWLM